jgi:hypothetical protein
VVVQRVAYGKARPTEHQRALFVASLTLLLNENLSDFSHIFTVVNLIPPATNSWLASVRSAYAYVRRESDVAGYLVILSVTADRDISGLQRTVDPQAFPATGNASFVITDDLFLRNVIAPGLASAFQTTPTPSPTTRRTACCATRGSFR